MERAYRRRAGIARWALSGAAFALLTFVHFTFGSPWLWGPPLVAALVCAGLLGWGERLLFPLAWRTFDAPRASPALEEEARALARTMGVRPGRLRERRDRRWAGAWRGRTLEVPPWYRELPPDERRYALARDVAHAPDVFTVGQRLVGWPLFFVGFAAWSFGHGDTALVLGLFLFASLIAKAVLWDRRQGRSRKRAREVAGEPGRRAYLARLASRGAGWAAWELKRRGGGTGTVPDTLDRDGRATG